MLCAGDDATPRAGLRRRRDGVASLLDDGIPILVVDDDAGFRDAARRVLAATPFRPIAIGTGADALRYLMDDAARADVPYPAFVVLDFNLPDTKAPAVIAALRRDARTRALPVLVVSQIPGAADATAALDAGAQGYHAKPSRAARLRELVRDFWREHGPPDGDPDR